MPGTLPLGPGVESIGFQSVDPTLADTVHSGKANVRKLAGQYFSVTLRWPRLKKSEHRPIKAFLLQQRGRFETFDVVIPEISTPDGVATGVPLVKGAGQSGTTLIVDGLTASTVGILLALDVFKLAGHNKVYQLIAPADTNASGETTLQFIPPLIETPADNEALTIVAVPFKMRLLRDPIDTDLKKGLYDLEADLVEDI